MTNLNNTFCLAVHSSGGLVSSSALYAAEKCPAHLNHIGCVYSKPTKVQDCPYLFYFYWKNCWREETS